MSQGSVDGHASADVLIVGAGPTGLTLACDLARRGVAARIVDKIAEPFVGSRGKGLQPRTLEIFDDLGVIDRILGEGSDYPRLRVHVGPLRFPWDLIKRARRTPEVPYPNLWLLPQARTEAILRARFATLGGVVEFGTECATFTQRDDAVTATLVRDGVVERVRARYLVGADGGHSVVRKTLGVPFSGENVERSCAVVGDVRIDQLDRRFWHVWPWARWGIVALCPLPHGDLFQIFVQLAPSTRDVDLTEAGVRRLVADAVGKPLKIHDPSWTSFYRPNVRLVDRYRVKRVFLAGDAAHVHPPTGAEGMNLGVQDAYNLGWKLAAVLSGAREDLLETYEEERRPVGARVLGTTTALYDGGIKRPRKGDDADPSGSNYRRSSLSVEAGVSPKRLHAGDRAPDAVCIDESGEPRRLFDAYRGPRATLLGFGSHASKVAGRVGAGRNLNVVPIVASRLDAQPGSLEDRGGRTRRSYEGDRNRLILIRPDGYVGLVASAASADAVRAYLDRVGVFVEGSEEATSRKCNELSPM